MVLVMLLTLFFMVESSLDSIGLYLVDILWVGLVVDACMSAGCIECRDDITRETDGNINDQVVLLDVVSHTFFQLRNRSSHLPDDMAETDHRFCGRNGIDFDIRINIFIEDVQPVIEVFEPLILLGEPIDPVAEICFIHDLPSLDIKISGLHLYLLHF